MNALNNCLGYYAYNPRNFITGSMGMRRRRFSYSCFPKELRGRLESIFALPEPRGSLQNCKFLSCFIHSPFPALRTGAAKARFREGMN